MALYFADYYISNGGYIPNEMVDKNIKTDYNKMTKLIRFEKNFGEKTSLIQRIMNEGQIYVNIIDEFALDELTSWENLMLMYYMGLLAIGGYDIGETLLVIPNATISRQYFRYLKETYSNIISWKTDENIMTDLRRLISKRASTSRYCAIWQVV